MTNKATILVVDDSSANLLLLKDILTTYEYTVLLESGGEKVVNVLENNVVDLVLLDIMMPGISGFDVCKLIKANDKIKSIPVIFLTAKVDESSLLYGFEIGGVDYIKKPFLVSELMARVHTHIELRRATLALEMELNRHKITQDQLKKSESELRIRNQIAEAFLLNSTDTLFNKLLGPILEYNESQTGFIGYINDADYLVCPTLADFFPDKKAAKEAIIFEKSDWKGIWGECLLNGVSIVKNEQLVLPFGHQTLRNALSCPILYNGEPVGLITLGNKIQGYSKDDVLRLERLSVYVSSILYDRLQANKEMKARNEAENMLKESEEKYRTLFNENNDAVFIFAAESTSATRFKDVNETAIQLFGYQYDEFLKMSMIDLVLPYNIQNMSERLQQVIEKGSAQFETYYKAKDDTVIPVELSARLFSYKGQLAIMSVVRNIKERVDLNKMIVNKVIETEEKERSRFSKDIHDGVGAILSSINTYIHLLERKKITEAEMPSALHDMKNLINEAMVSTKEIANNLIPNILSNFGLVTAVNSLITKLNYASDIVFNFDPSNYSDNLGDKVKVHLFRIFSEIINNALIHSGAKQVNLFMHQENNILRIDYKDNGVGADLSEINTKFSLGQSNGIQNIKARVSALNGEMVMRTTKGNGFSISIVINTDKLDEYK